MIPPAGRSPGPVGRAQTVQLEVSNFESLTGPARKAVMNLPSWKAALSHCVLHCHRDRADHDASLSGAGPVTVTVTVRSDVTGLGLGARRRACRLSLSSGPARAGAGLR